MKDEKENALNALEFIECLKKDEKRKTKNERKVKNERHRA